MLRGVGPAVEAIASRLTSRRFAGICALAIAANPLVGCQLVAGIHERPLDESNDAAALLDGGPGDASTTGDVGGGPFDAAGADAIDAGPMNPDAPSGADAETRNDADARQPDASTTDGGSDPGPHFGTVAFKTLSAGLGRTCGVKINGEIACWGRLVTGIAPMPGPFSQVSVGDEHLCAVKTDMTAVCWGNNSNRQTEAPAGVFFKEVVTGTAHSCGRRMVETAVCWGDNQKGQAAEPTSLYDQVAAGGDRTCLRGYDGAVRCQGFGATPQLQPGGLFEQISTSGTMGCGLVKGVKNITCWRNDGTVHPLALMGSFTGVSVGATHVCGLEASGSIKCTGSNDSGESTPPSANGPFSEVAAGAGHTCAVRVINQFAVCWGNNASGQAKPP